MEPSVAERVLYVERPGRVRLWATLGVLATVAVLGPGTVQQVRDSGSLPVGALLFLVPLFGLVFCVPALVAYSRRRYHGITVTGGLLSVGRDGYRVADLDPASVDAALREGEPSTRERVATSLGAVDAPVLRATTRGEPALAGGSWAVTAGKGSVVLGLRNGAQVRVQVEDRAAFLTALRQAVGQVRRARG